MDAYALFDALTDVRDGFLEETERRLHGKKRRRMGGEENWRLEGGLTTQYRVKGPSPSTCAPER